MRLASARTGLWLAPLPLTVLLSGCVTTQRIAARERLVNDRIRLSQATPVLTASDPAVRVGRPVLIRSQVGTAVVVPLVNGSSRVLTDLPIVIGVRTRGARARYLNRSSTLDYFQSHIAVIAPGAATTWVFTTGQRVPRTARPFARVGYPQLHPPAPHGLPGILARLRSTGSGAGGQSVELSLVNRSAVPQYDLPVYAVAIRDGREVAAGSTSVAHLGTHGTTTLRMTLLGEPDQATVRLIALPTIFS